jgi:hypothetical protein
MLACKRGHLKVVEVLLDNGANVDISMVRTAPMPFLYCKEEILQGRNIVRKDYCKE